jgi:hypothetical protein
LDLVKYVALFASTFLTSSGEALIIGDGIDTNKGVPRDYGNGRTEAQNFASLLKMRLPKSSNVLMRLDSKQRKGMQCNGYELQSRASCSFVGSRKLEAA